MTMSSLDKEFETLIIRINKAEKHEFELIAENEGLKAQVNNLLKACQLYGDCIDFGNIAQANEADNILSNTNKQCLSSVKSQAVEEFVKYIEEYGTLSGEDDKFLKDLASKLRANNKGY